MAGSVVHDPVGFPVEFKPGGFTCRAPDRSIERTPTAALSAVFSCRNVHHRPWIPSIKQRIPLPVVVEPFPGLLHRHADLSTARLTPQDREEHSRAIHRPEPMATIPADLPRFASHLEHTSVHAVHPESLGLYRKRTIESHV